MIGCELELNLKYIIYICITYLKLSNSKNLEHYLKKWESVAFYWITFWSFLRWKTKRSSFDLIRNRIILEANDYGWWKVDPFQEELIKKIMGKVKWNLADNKKKDIPAYLVVLEGDCSLWF